ncbi:MAG TPA: pitrilysin family protein [Vicinamibacteria bacterium]|nr:pitrilysin family protein [Vicinamibacteria bacterium]
MMIRVVLLTSVLGVFATSSASAQKYYKDLVYPPLAELQVPEVTRVELANGLRLYLVEDHSLPKVEGMALIQTGSRLEPATKVGLGSIVGQVLRTGGSVNRSGEEIDRLLENVGSVIETGVGTTSGSATLFALSEHVPLVVAILADVLRDPAFPEDKIELAKVQERTAIARRNDDVAGIASREFQKVLYGGESPYARTTEYATIESISRDDLLDFHRNYFLPNRIQLGLWGDFETSDVQALVERHFGSWERGPSPEAALPEAPRPTQGRVYYISKEDVNQTNLRIGHLGGRYDDPDYFALTVMSEILGGGFSSRLFQSVRRQSGLAYRVGASWDASFDYPGTFTVASSTKSESTVETIEAILDEIERIVAEPVSEEELRIAKESLLNSFVFNFASRGAIVRRLMTYDYYGYPSDFLRKYQESIGRVSVDDVHRVARNRLNVGALHVLAVGREEDFDAPLSTLGEVVTLDITIPEPPAMEAPPPTEEALAKGREILRKFVASVDESAGRLGGFSLSGETVLKTPQGDLPARFEIQFRAPERYRELAVLPFGEMETVLDGPNGWASTPRGVQELGEDQKRRTREGIYRHYPGLLWAAASGKVEAQSLADDAVLLRIGEMAMRGRFDRATGRLFELSLPGTNLQGAPVTEKREFSRYDERGFPIEVRVFHDGALAAETRIDSTAIDPDTPEELFRKPEGR